MAHYGQNIPEVQNGEVIIGNGMRGRRQSGAGEEVPGKRRTLKDADDDVPLKVCTGRSKRVYAHCRATPQIGQPTAAVRRPESAVSGKDPQPKLKFERHVLNYDAA